MMVFEKHAGATQRGRPSSADLGIESRLHHPDAVRFCARHGRRPRAGRAMWLSPRDFLNTTFLMIAGDADINLGDFDAAIDAYRRALDSGFREFFVYARLSAAYADAGRIEEAKASLVEARRLNPKFTVKSMIEHMPNWPAVFEGVRKAGLPEE